MIVIFFIIQILYITLVSNFIISDIVDYIGFKLSFIIQIFVLVLSFITSDVVYYIGINIYNADTCIVYYIGLYNFRYCIGIKLYIISDIVCYINSIK